MIRQPAPSAVSLLLVVLITAILHTALIVIYVVPFGGDLSALVCVDENRAGRWPFERIEVGFPAGGYDGQFYYVIARNPLARQSREVVDFPSYRHVRILYPALAWLLSAGAPGLLLWVLPAINLAAISALSMCGALLATHYHRSPWWGIVLPFVLNAGMPALRDLTDPLATAALCAVLTAFLLDWKVWQLALCAGAAVFSREQNAVALVIIMGGALLDRCWPRTAALAAVLIGWSGWVGILRLSYGEWPFAVGNLGAPLSGIWYALQHLSGQHGRPPVINILGLLQLSLQIALCGVLLANKAERLTAALAVAGIGLVLLGGIPIYQSGWSYVRTFVWMPLGIWLWSMQSARRWPVVLLMANGFWTILATARPWLG